MCGCGGASENLSEAMPAARDFLAGSAPLWFLVDPSERCSQSVSAQPLPDVSPSFASLTLRAKRVMVLDLGFLGDTIHLLPALWTLRQHYKEAELHVMVADHVIDLLECAPWIDQVWGYPRFPKGPKPWQDLGRVRGLREARFDALINCNGSDRSSFLSFFSGARWRLGRCEEVSLKKRILFTHPIAFPRQPELVSRQHCRFLGLAGFPDQVPPYHISLPAQAKESTAALLGHPLDQERRYIHVSPFTTQDYKELPLEVLSALLNRLHQSVPAAPLVVSCANNARELQKLERLLAQLTFKPHRVFSGTLSLPEMVAVLSACRLHLGGDSGGVHMAVMAGTPTVSWFRRYAGSVEWMPTGDAHSALVGEASPEGIQGISEETLLREALAFLKA